MRTEGNPAIVSSPTSLECLPVQLECCYAGLSTTLREGAGAAAADVCLACKAEQALARLVGHDQLSGASSKQAVGPGQGMAYKHCKDCQVDWYARCMPTDSNAWLSALLTIPMQRPQAIAAHMFIPTSIAPTACRFELGCNVSGILEAENFQQ